MVVAVLLKPRFFMLLSAERLDERDGSQDLIDMGGNFPFLLPLFLGGGLELPDQDEDESTENRQGREGDEGQSPVQQAHDHHHAEKRQGMADHRERPVGKDIPERRGVARHFGEQFAGTGLMVERQRQAL